MSTCIILENFTRNFKEKLGYYPSYEQCFIFLQGSGMNEIQVSNCMSKYLANPGLNGGLYGNPTNSVRNMRVPYFKEKKPHYNNGDISMGVL
jgi:hypothetical protein